MGRVKKVDLYENGTIAIVEAVRRSLFGVAVAHSLLCVVQSLVWCDNGPYSNIFSVQVSPELGNRVQRVRVQLPGTSQELLQKFRSKGVDFAAHSNTEDSNAVLFNLLGAS